MPVTPNTPDNIKAHEENVRSAFDALRQHVSKQDKVMERIKEQDPETWALIMDYPDHATISVTMREYNVIKAMRGES